MCSMVRAYNLGDQEAEVGLSQVHNKFMIYENMQDSSIPQERWSLGGLCRYGPSLDVPKTNCEYMGLLN